MPMSGTAKDAEIEKYKALIRNSNAYEDMNRSQELVSPYKSPKKKIDTGNSPHKWGKPVSPEQYRPDDWLGSPASGKGKKGYKIKTLPTTLPIDVDLDSESVDTANISTTKSEPTTTTFATVASNEDKSIATKMSDESSARLPPKEIGKGSILKSEVDPATISPKPESSSMVTPTASPSKFTRAKHRVSAGSDGVVKNGAGRHSTGGTDLSSDGTIPGVPSMFAASISPRTSINKNYVLKSPKTPTLPDPKKYIAMRNQNSDVPAAFRSVVSTTPKRQSDSVIGRYGLSPMVAGEGYADVRNGLKAAVKAPDLNDNDELDPNIPAAFKATATRRQKFAKLRSSSQSDVMKGTPKMSSLVAAKFKHVPISKSATAVAVSGGGMKPSSLSPKRPSRERASSPKPPRSPRNSSHSPKPPLSPKRVSAPNPVSLPDILLSDSDDDVAAGESTTSTRYNHKRHTVAGSSLTESSDPATTKINTKKFLRAFSSFEEKEGPPISSDPMSTFQKKSKPKKIMSLTSARAPNLYQSREQRKQRSRSVRSVSPARNAPRNFTISPQAKKKDAAISSQDSLNGSEHSTNELSDLQNIIAQLRKVNKEEIAKNRSKKLDKSDLQASEILEIMRNLRKVNDSQLNRSDAGTRAIASTMENLKLVGIIGCRIVSDEVQGLEKALLRLGKVHQKLNEGESSYRQIGNVLKKLQKIIASPSSHDDRTPMIENVVSELQKVVSKLYVSYQPETYGVISDLKNVLLQMREREVGELAGVIRGFGDSSSADNAADGGEEELARVIKNLKSLCSDAKRRPQRGIGINLPENDSEFLTNAIERLKKANMTNKEAVECAAVIRKLNKVAGDNAPSNEFDDEILRLRSSMNSKEKGDEVGSVIKGLRKLNMGERDWNELGDMISSLRKGSGSKIPPEIADVISKLRKTKMTQKEAKEAAAIVFNLRKTPHEKRTPEEREREMVKLRKVLPKDTSEDLFDMVWDLGDADLGGKATSEIVDAIAELGDGSTVLSSPEDNSFTEVEEYGSVETSKHPLLSVSDEDGNPEMILRFTEGESGPDEVLGETLHWDRGVSYRGSKKPDAGSDNEDSDYEDDSTVEVESLDGGEKRTTIDGEIKNMKLPQGRDGNVGGNSLHSVSLAGDEDSTVVEVESDIDSDGDDDDNGSIQVTEFGLEKAEQGSENSEKKFHYSCPLVYEPDTLGNDALEITEGDKKKKVVFNQKPKWIHKKHNNTVVGEKRWRFHEGFGADEVIFSPLSRQQYDRRKRISESLLASLGGDMPFGKDDDDTNDFNSSYNSEKIREFMDMKDVTGRRSTMK